MCSTELVAYRGRRSLTVVDAASGEWRWELRDVPTDARFQVTRDLMLMSSIKWPNGVLLRARDGQELPLDEELRAKFQNAKLVIGADLIVLSRTNQEGKAEAVVERWNPLRRATVWKKSFSTADQFQWLDPQTLVSLGTDHSLNLLDLESGERRTLGNLKPGDSTNRSRSIGRRSRSTPTSVARSWALPPTRCSRGGTTRPSPKRRVISTRLATTVNGAPLCSIWR